jgi:hypothetical protein
MDPIEIVIVFDRGSWRMRVGEVLSPPYKTQGAAMQAAITRARSLGRDGYETEVVMPVLTCRFGPNGLA